MLSIKISLLHSIAVGNPAKVIRRRKSSKKEFVKENPDSGFSKAEECS